MATTAEHTVADERIWAGFTALLLATFLVVSRLVVRLSAARVVAFVRAEAVSSRSCDLSAYPAGLPSKRDGQSRDYGAEARSPRLLASSGVVGTGSQWRLER